MSRFAVVLPPSGLALDRLSLPPHPHSARTLRISEKTTQELRVFDPSLIDKTVDPCENFYRYSCNGWFKRNPLPPDQTRYGRFTELYELNRLHLKQILEDASKARSRPARPMSRRSATNTRAAWTRPTINQARHHADQAGTRPHCRT